METIPREKKCTNLNESITHHQSNGVKKLIFRNMSTQEFIPLETSLDTEVEPKEPDTYYGCIKWAFPRISFIIVIILLVCGLIGLIIVINGGILLGIFESLYKDEYNMTTGCKFDSECGKLDRLLCYSDAFGICCLLAGLIVFFPECMSIVLIIGAVTLSRSLWSCYKTRDKD